MARSLEHLEKIFTAEGETPAARHMSLRDWFAGQALASGQFGTARSCIHETARSSYAVADAMLAERSKKS